MESGGSKRRNIEPDLGVDRVIEKVLQGLCSMLVIFPTGRLGVESFNRVYFLWTLRQRWVPRSRRLCLPNALQILEENSIDRGSIS